MSSVFPPAFEARMRNTLHQDWSAFEKVHEEPAPVSIRLHPEKKITPSSTDAVLWTPQGRYLKERPVFTLDPAFHAGAYYVQEASSMLLEQAVRKSVDLTKPLCVLDLCAAPGGKSTHLISLLNSQSFLVTNEVIRSRAGVLAENMLKWGYPNVVVTSADPENFTALRGVFDLIVVDAPCSGEGLFRKDPEAKEEWSEANVALCASRQKRILNAVWPALKEGGTLLYCTCTYNADENEKNIQWLSEEKGATFQDINPDDSWGVEKVGSDSVFGYRCYPHKINGEGFFISAIRKDGEENEARIKSHKKPFTFPDKKIVESCSRWLKQEYPLAILQFQETLLALPSHYIALVEWLSDHVHIVQAGTSLAVEKHHKFIPDHALALSVALDPSKWPVLALNREQALHYLRKENIPVEHDLPRGFALVTYEGLGLGWVNILDNRMNNLYPANWRIRMSGNG